MKESSAYSTRDWTGRSCGCSSRRRTYFESCYEGVDDIQGAERSVVERKLWPVVRVGRVVGRRSRRARMMMLADVEDLELT